MLIVMPVSAAVYALIYVLMFFKMDDDKAIVHTDPVPAKAEKQCQNAADECPVTAITIE
jgi:ferredoxin